MSDEQPRDPGSLERPSAPKGGERRLYEALRLFLETDGPEASRERLIDEHPDLRDELAPLLEASQSTLSPAAGGTQLGALANGEQRAGTVIGDYRIVRKLGEGGMGVVYEAEQISLRRPVALKLLMGGTANSAKRRARFRREAEAGGRVRHKNIVAVYAVGEHDGMPFIAQELVDNGRSLAHWFVEQKRSGAIDDAWQRRIARFFANAAHAVQAAHDAGVVHRDVKPKNILIGADDEPKVADFGLAWIQVGQPDLEISATNDQVGTPFYMSPEQIDHAWGDVDERSDVFSLGAALYEALTLEKPFEGELPQQIFDGILREEPVDPRKRAPLVSRDLAAICLKALEKRPVRRYQTMRAFAEDLERWLAGEAVSARPPSRLGWIARVARRRWTVVVALVVVAVAVGIAIEAKRSTDESRRRELLTLVDNRDLLIERLFDTDVLVDEVRFQQTAADVNGRVAEKFSEYPQIASQLLEAVGVAAIFRETGPADRELARTSLAAAAQRIASRDLVGAALLALRAERMSQEAGDRAAALAIRDEWIARLQGAKSGEGVLARELFEAERDLADMLAGDFDEAKIQQLEAFTERLLALETNPRMLRAAREVAVSLCEAFDRHEEAANIYALLWSSTAEGADAAMEPSETPTPPGVAEASGSDEEGETTSASWSRVVDRLDRLNWRSRRTFELAVAGDISHAHSSIQECMAERQSLVGSGSVGYRQDELRAGYIDYARGDIIGLATTIERVLAQLERFGRGSSEDALFGLRLLCDVRIQAAEEADDVQRSYAFRLASDALERALAATREARGDEDRTVLELAAKLDEVRIILEEPH